MMHKIQRAARAAAVLILFSSLLLAGCVIDLEALGEGLQTAAPELGLPTLAAPQEILETIGAGDLLSTLIPGTPRPLVTPMGDHQAQACLPPGTERTTARLERVIDGDTIDVRIEGETFRVRYIGVDTPERGEPFYSEATQMNTELLGEGQLVLVRDVSQTDRFDRLLRYVLVDEVFVNYELVIQGYAESVTFPPDVACEETFRQAARQAREAQRGLWGD